MQQKKRWKAVLLSIVVIFLTPITTTLVWLASFCSFDLIAVMQWGGIIVCNICTVCLGLWFLGMSCVLHETEL